MSLTVSEIFSPLRGTENQYAEADGTDFSHPDFQKYLTSGYSSQHADDSLQEINQAVPLGRRSQSIDEVRSNGTAKVVVSGNRAGSDDGFVSPHVSQDYSDHSSPKSVSSPSKRMVSVSIPQATSMTSPHYDSSPNQNFQDSASAISSSNMQLINSNQQNTQLDHGEGMQVNAAWEIPISEADSNKSRSYRDPTKLQQRSTSQRKPFVSSVKSDIDSYHPKVQAHLDSSRRDTNLPRPKTKGSDMRPNQDSRNFNRVEQSQRPITQGQGQRTGSDDLSKNSRKS